MSKKKTGEVKVNKPLTKGVVHHTVAIQEDYFVAPNGHVFYSDSKK